MWELQKTRINTMDKIDLIYDTVRRIEEQNIKRFELIEKDICEIKRWKSTFVGYVGGLSSAGTVIFNVIKDFFIK